MARISAYATIQEFLKKANPVEKPTQLALGLSPSLANLFCSGLDLVKDDLGNEIPGLPALMVKLKIPSSYLQGLKEKGMVQKDKKNSKGKWFLTTDAVKKMAAFVRGDAPEVAETKDSKPKKTKAAKPKKTVKGGKRRKNAKHKTKGFDSSKLAKMTVGDLMSRLGEIHGQRLALSEEEGRIGDFLKNALKSLDK